MDSIRSGLIIIVLVTGVVCLILIKRWLIRSVGEKVYKHMSIFSSTNASKHGTPDPLAEAEVYIAYGRKKQALAALEISSKQLVPLQPEKLGPR